ncbi:MAG: hypothetical protein J2P57_05470 [Acidimicrobiaceae bacterium]|nr:hypothetical protein [Acidimicrobiaceae bacterium]
MTDIDEQLRSYADRWRTAQPPPPQPTFTARSARPRFPRFEHPARLVAIAATVAILIAAVAAFAATRHSDSTRVSTANPTEVPVARAPLRFYSEPPPRTIRIATGRSGRIRWLLAASYLPKETGTRVDPQLCLLLAVSPGPGGQRCDNPATMPSLTANIERPRGDQSTLFITGVTSAPAATFSVTVGTASLSTPALSTPALVGLRFYVIQVPAGDYQPNRGVAVEALAADGAALLRNNPRLTATIPLG